ncbi:MAG: RNA-binding protein [Candidatus Gracilibacteria bacterium]|jgi:RNA recognition motif-containing protein
MQTKKLFVRNLPFNATEDQLREFFMQFGAVDTAVIIKDRQTGRSKGFGFVEMSTMEEAEAAVAQAGDGQMTMGERQIFANEAQPREERPRRDDRY